MNEHHKEIIKAIEGIREIAEGYRELVQTLRGKDKELTELRYEFFSWVIKYASDNKDEVLLKELHKQLACEKVIDQKYKEIIDILAMSI